MQNFGQGMLTNGQHQVPDGPMCGKISSAPSRVDFQTLGCSISSVFIFIFTDSSELMEIVIFDDHQNSLQMISPSILSIV